MGKLLGTSKVKDGQESMGEAVAMMREQAKKAEALQIPEEEKQRIKYEMQKIYMPTEGEVPDLDKMQAILAQIPGGEAMLQDVYAGYKDLAAKGGLSPEQRNVFDQLQGQASAQTKAQLTSIDQQMAERGTESSGLSAALKAQAVQQQAMRSQAEARDMAAKSAEAQRDVMGQQAGVAQQLGGLQQGRQGALAQGEQSKAQNLAEFQKLRRTALQAQEEERVGTTTKQREHESALSRQKFEDEYRKRQLASGIASSASNTLMQQGAAQAQAGQASAAAKQALVGAGIGAAGMMSDINAKKNISKGEVAVRKLLDNLDPYKYDYKDEKHGEDDQLGVMAQDLEKSKEGKKFVIDTDEGKMVDFGKMGPTMMASLADLNDRLKKMEKSDKYEDGGVKSNEIKKNAVSGMANQKKDLEYSPKLDAKEQIAQFNKTNFRGNAYSLGGANMMDAGGAGKLADQKDIGSTITPEQEVELEAQRLSDKQAKRDDLLKKNQALVAELKPKDKIIEGVGGFGDDLANAAISKAKESTAFYDSMARQNSGPGDLFNKAMSQPQKAGLQSLYADGGVGEDPSSYKDVLDKNQPEIEGVDQDNIEDLISGLNNFEPEEVEQKLNEFKDEVKAKMPEEQFNQLSEYFDSVMQKRQPAAVPEVEPEIGEFPTEDTYDQGGLYQDGGMNHMAYKDGGEGTVIPGESYAGDKLPDRINSGEAVINIEQQQRLLDLLKELKGKRVDEMADDGDVQVNRDAQDKFMAIARGQAEPEHIEDDENIVEARGMKKLLGMLGRK